MTRRVVYLWWAIRTGLGFAVFGVGALVIALGVLPVLRMVPGDHERRAQRLVQVGFRLWIWFTAGIGLLRVRWRGRERWPARGPVVIAANHPTLIDVVLLVARLPQADCVVKAAARRNPFLRWAVAAAGYLDNDAGSGLVEACVSRLRQGRCLVLFPEGTRSPARRLAPLRRGAAHMAVRAGAPLIPVTITCEPPSLMKGQPWWRVPGRTVEFTIDVGEPLWPETTVPRSVAVRRVTEEMRGIYERTLSRARA
jgi:1-acyl-sn-glycerol-3-phosphate acyltransferase